ncbi:calcium-binding protein [Roseomonas sp. E05]|uniref:beta strand repeat-containing protein n=1 Tax=Roseomonas sp. E05 TaxID=3046310 RepID=UPI0024BB12CD|nr:calcium-binding protein [Roseomonas sp. E05]MDJ0387714.1 calcium-binding protein [Roseomonas sp. E05]
MEPRLLLSGTTVNAAALQALHDNFAHLETVLEGVEGEGVFAQAIPLMNINDSHLAGEMLAFSKVFESNIADPVKALINAVPADSGALAAALQSAINDLTDADTGHQVQAQVTDISAGSVIGLTIQVADLTTQSFSIDLGDTATPYGINFPTVTGTAELSYGFTFTVRLDTAALGASPTDAQEAAAFNLSSASFTTGFHATADLAGTDFSFGLLTLTVAPGAAGIDQQAGYEGAIADISGTDLRAAASAIEGGDHSSLRGAGALVTASIASQTDGTATPLLDLPVILTGDHVIPGITPFETPVHLTVTGHAAAGDAVVDLEPLLDALRNSVGDPDFDPRSLNTFAAKDLVTQLAKVGTYLGYLSGGEDLAVEIPFTDGLTIGDVINVATTFKSDIIDPLQAVVGVLGFTEGQHNTDGANFMEGAALTAANLAHLPDQIAMMVTLDNGKSASLSFAPTYLDSSKVSHKVETVDDLALAMNQAIAASALAGYLQASNDAGRIALTLTAPSSGTAATKVTVASAQGATVFSNLRDFGILLAKTLRLPGWDDTTSDPTEVGDRLLTALGLAYDAGTNAITLSISKEFEMPDVLADVSFDLDLSGVAGLSVSNASFHLTSSVLLNLTVGFSLDPLGSHVNQEGGPQIGDGQNGTPSTTVGELPVYVAASNGGEVPITANEIADARDPGTTHTNLADLQIIGRDGVVATFVITPDMTLANLETAIANAFGREMEVRFNALGNTELEIIDTEAAYDGPSPASLGLTVGTLAQANAVNGSSTNYQAVLEGTPVDDADYAAASKFILTIGKLPPVVVDVAAGSGSVAAYATAINTALAQLSLDPALIGLSSGTLHYSDIVRASVGSNGAVQLTTTIYDAIVNAQHEAPYLSTQRSAVRYGLQVDAVQLTVSALNNSLLPGLLGLIGKDINDGAGDQALIIGSPLHGETLTDRFFLKDTGISATIDMALEPTDPTQPVAITGTLGGFEFGALLYDPEDPDAELGAYVSLRAALLLNYDGNAEPNTITFAQLSDSLSNGSFSDIWAFTLGSGRGDEPFAMLDIKSVSLSAGGVDLASVASPEIIITLDDASQLLSLSVPSPQVEVIGLDAKLVVADVVEAVRQVFQSMNSDLANQTIPLVNVSLDDILGFSSKFLVALSEAEQDPDAALGSIQTAINDALGGDYVHFSLEDQDHLILSIAYTPVDVHTQLPFNLDLDSLADFLGSDGSALHDLVDAIGSIASLSASGTLDVSAGVSLALTLGINLGDNSHAAGLNETLATLNGRNGLRTGTAGKPDLQFTLGSGRVFTVSVGALGASATVQDLLDAINTAAGQADFASYDDATGAIVFHDSSTSPASGLSDLGFQDGQTSVDTGSTSSITAASAVTDPSQAYSFAISIGTDVTVEVSVGADASRTTLAGLVTAIRSALATTLVSAADLLHENVRLPGSAGSLDGDFDVALGQIISVAGKNGKLVFSAKDSVLGTDADGNLLNTFRLSEAQPKLTLTVESINGSQIAEDLGLGGKLIAQDETVDGVRTIAGRLTAPNSTSERFFIETGEDPDTHELLTGIRATLGIEASNLSFTAALGPLSATIVNGHAILGADLGMVAAGEDGFAVGGIAAAPATFLITLDDGFGGATAGEGILTFANLAKLGSAGNSLSDLIHFSANAALEVSLPVVMLGQQLGPVELQIGNLFNTTGVDGLPERSVHTAFPSLDGISVGSILNDPQTLIDGLDAFLSDIAYGTFAQALYGLDLPLIGPALQGIGSFFATLHDSVIGTLQSLLDDFKTAHPGQPASTQNIITQGLEYVLTDLLHLPGDVYSYIDSIDSPTEISFVWHFDVTLLDTMVNLSADLGIPGLGLQIENGLVNLLAELDFTIGFGYLKDKGFFVYDMGVPGALEHFESNNDPNDVFVADFRELHAVELLVAVFMPTDPAFSATLNLGFLRMTATNGSTLSATLGGREYLGTSLTGSIYVDIGPADQTGRLLFSNFAKGSIIRSGMEMTLNVDLLLDSGFGIGIGSTSTALPSVSTELLFSYAFNKVFTGAIGDEPESGIVTPLTFLDVTLDVGSFLNTILKPILDTMGDVIEPIQPILDFLTSPIPGLSQIVGSTSVLDLAQQFGGPKVQDAVRFIQILDDVAGLVRSLQSMQDSGGIKVNFGTFVFGQTDDPDATSLSGSNLDPFAGKVSQADVSAAASYFQNSSAGSAAADAALARLSAQSHSNIGGQLQSLENAKGAGGKAVFDFPILHDPMSIVKLLMGQVNPVDLVHVTLPTFDFNFSKELPFRFLIGPVPVTVTFYASVGVEINLAFGYDTTGIIKFMSNNNPLMLMDGFYVDNTIGPQLDFYATFGVTAAVNLALVAAGVGGEISGHVTFQLHDVSGDGKLHASELLTALLDNPLHLFDIAGQLDALVYAFVWVGIDLPIIGKITLFEASFDIIDVTLLSFSYNYSDVHSTPSLAQQESDGTLTLNMGKNADRQEVGSNLTNPSQTYEIAHVGGTAGNEDIAITANGVTTVYHGVKVVVADVGDGNNVIRFGNGYVGNVTITGGSGNNIIDLGGVDGDPLITLGDGNNVVFGASIDTTIVAGNGNNTIFGGNARNTITVGSGRNTIVGGAAQDTITAGTGDNTIYGGAGDDVIVAGSGNNTIWGGEGANVISISGGAGQNIIFGHGANSLDDVTSTTVTATLVSANAASANDISSTITGGSGRDIIFGGGGDNTISTGAGADIVFGGLGSVTRTAQGQLIQASATSGVGGHNVITGGAGDKILFGGGGDNTITSGGGNDIILAGGGTVDGAAGGSAGRFTVSGMAFGSHSVVDGGLGNDLVLGSGGSNAITGGGGDDIIGGHAAIVVRDAAIGRTAHLLSVQTSLEGIGGNDVISGGAGNDIILGGAGSHTIDAGTGSDVVIGHYGQVTATNAGQNLTIEGWHGAAAGNGDNVITASHSAVIMGGGGNNTITTYDATSPADPANNLPAITAADRQMLVFGANGIATVDLLLAGGIKIHQARTVAGEEDAGGNNRITVGDGNDIVFGGAGTNTITAGNGDNIILGHTGFVDLDRLASPDTTGRSPDVIGYVLGQDGTALRGTGSTITSGTGNNVILGGTGNNVITTTGAGNNIIFGAAGAVTRDGTAGNALLYAETLEESLAGDNTITAGLGFTGANVVFGGIGNNHIAVGDGNNVVLGHLGVVNNVVFSAFTDAARADGARPDVLARTVPERGTLGHSALWPNATLDRAVASTSAVITAGRGDNVILGGAGDNTITAGDGNNTVFGASGAVTRYAVSKQVAFATTVEESLGGDHAITLGDGANLVFGGAGYNQITVGNRDNIVFGHLGQVNYSVLTDFSTAQRATGNYPDLIGRVLPAIGNSQPYTTAPFGGLDQPLAEAGSVIHAGNGANIIFGGAGDNTIVAGTGSNTIFGAGGAVTRDTRASAVLFAETVEETQGGNNTIYAGARSTATQVVFGGPGFNTIRLGDGANVVLGHLGYVDLGAMLYYTSAQRADGSHPDVVGRIVPERGNISPITPNGSLGLDQAPLGGGSDIRVGGGRNVIIGGAGDNHIYTGHGNNIVFGAAGAVTRDARSLSLLHATTVEETLGGNNFLELSLGGTGSAIAFGGPGKNLILTGYGNDIVLGHLGTVAASVRSTGAGPQDLVIGERITVTGRSVPVIGNLQPSTTAPYAGLGQLLPNSEAVINAGAGDNLIIGGVGANAVPAGDGNNPAFGASATAQRDRSGATLSAQVLEAALAERAELILGGGVNTVFNTAPAPSFAPAAQAAAVPAAGVFLVAGSETLSSGASLADLAAAAQLQRSQPAETAAVEAPASAPAAMTARTGSSTPTGYVLDEATGNWVADDGADPMLLLLLTGGAAPELTVQGNSTTGTPRPRLAA